jgi:hypothetical protein
MQYMLPDFGEFRCAGCGRIHFRIRAEVAARNIAAANARPMKEGEEPATLARYMRCGNCGAPSWTFRAVPGDEISTGTPRYGCVIP